MDIKIINGPFTIELYGFSGTAANGNWAKTGFSLMNKMWAQIKTANLKHKGINVWVYEESNRLFAGVELESTSKNNTGLELKQVTLPKYAYYKHIGPYSQIAPVGEKARDEISAMGLKTGLPYIEIYGHWAADETKLETELLWCLK